MSGHGNMVSLGVVGMVGSHGNGNGQELQELWGCYMAHSQVPMTDISGCGGTMHIVAT